jgi:hypothetical protein
VIVARTDAAEAPDYYIDLPELFHRLYEGAPTLALDRLVQIVGLLIERLPNDIQAELLAPLLSHVNLRFVKKL